MPLPWNDWTRADGTSSQAHWEYQGCSFQLVSWDPTEGSLISKSEKWPGEIWGSQTMSWSYSILQTDGLQPNPCARHMHGEWVAPDLSMDGHLTASLGNLSSTIWPNLIWENFCYEGQPEEKQTFWLEASLKCKPRSNPKANHLCGFLVPCSKFTFSWTSSRSLHTLRKRLSHWHVCLLFSKTFVLQNISKQKCEENTSFEMFHILLSMLHCCVVVAFDIHLWCL